ncbi:MAG: D-alanyl-D-alanine carboxypeptidase [Oscillospiraceae bacterium]|nr:D-alanyl-D-alanine carboxypeptidase [Oscillospiraceae bacterium]
MRKCRFLTAILSLVMTATLLCPAALALEQPELMAKAALLMDAKYDQVLYEKNADQRMVPASLTKVMTAMLVLDEVGTGRLRMDQVVTASSTFTKGLAANGSTQNIRAGEQMSLQDLLYCLLVPSANEAANILAETVDGSIEAFVERMNAKAAELGCEDTQFVNPHGLHHPDHYSTARDLYRIARKAMENELFRTIVSTKRYEVPATNMHETRVFYNTNALLVTWYYLDSYLYDKTIGIKTGTTDEGGYCLLSAAQDEEQYLISVVLDAPMIPLGNGRNDRRHFTESRELFRWGFDNFSRRQIVDTATPVAQVDVTLSTTDHVLVRPAAQLERTLPNDMDLSKVVQTVQLDCESIPAPVEEGQVLGKLLLTYEGEELGAVDLISVSAAERSGLLYRLHQVKTFFAHPIVRILTAIAVIAVVVLILRGILTPSRSSRYGSRRYSGRRNYRGRRR